MKYLKHAPLESRCVVMGRGDQDGGGGQIAGTTIALLVRVVRRHAGTAGVDALVAFAGETRSPAELEDPARWTGYDAAVRLFTAGASVTGEPRLGYLVGEEMLRQYAGTEVAALFRSLGSPGEVLRNVAISATKFSTATLLEAVEVGDETAVVVAQAVAGSVRHPMMCDYTAGVLSQAPALFGMDPAEVVETTCQARGGGCCTYEVRWDPSTSPEADPERRIAHLEVLVASITERFEALQATASELVAADDVHHVMKAITERACQAVRAPQYVLAVRLGPSEPVRVEHQGFDTSSPPDALVADLLSDAPDLRNGSRVIVDVATSRQWFGRLAALCPDGSRFLPEERRLLQAYANSAASALQAASSLAEARRRQDTAQTLLGLARDLAEVASQEEVARRIAEAAPRMVGGRMAAVLLWDEQAQQLTCAGLAGLPPSVMAALPAIPVTPASTPTLGAMIADQLPLFVDLASGDAFLRDLLVLTGAAAAVVVPIVSGARLLGVVAAELPPRPVVEEDDLLERLAGLTAQAAIALENGRLLDRVRALSLHDPLSGLPNRTLLRDRIDQALAGGTRSGTWPVLLFVDLDRFKQINDTFGHETGDRVIEVVAERLRRSVRATDTVARMGGDEFAVLLVGLDDPSDAERVAELLVEAVREPLMAASRTIRLSASVGAVAATADDDHDSLLRRADAAMYEAKSLGRDTAVCA